MGHHWMSPDEWAVLVLAVAVGLMLLGCVVAAFSRGGDRR